MISSKTTSFVAGVLVANSAPHIATAVTGRKHLTPLRGRRSSPAVNGLWAGINLLAGCAVLRNAVPGRREPAEWDDRLLAFEAGYAAWAAWMAVSERLFAVNRPG